MLERRDSRSLQGADWNYMAKPVIKWWTDRGFYVNWPDPFHLHGTSYYSKLGLRREFFLQVSSSGDQVVFELVMNAQITEEGGIGGAAIAVLSLPVAAIGGAVSYDRYENEVRYLIHSFWGFLEHLHNRSQGSGKPVEEPTPPPTQGSGETVSCSGCGGGLEPGWVACPACGKGLK